MTSIPPKFQPRDPLASIPTDLPSEDNENMESAWHRDQMTLLIDSLRTRWAGRRDFFCGGNMFIHYSPTRVRNRDFRGPDFFAVLDVDGDRPRDYWAVWEEDSRTPDFILELLSPTTAVEDRTTKMRVYERTFRTPEYFLYDRDTRELEGYRLVRQRYRRIRPRDGRLRSETLGCWFGPWDGAYQGQAAAWVRMFEPDGSLVPVGREQEAAGRQVAEEARRAAEEAARIEATARQAAEEQARTEANVRQALEADVARLKAELERLRPSNP